MINWIELTVRQGKDTTRVLVNVATIQRIADLGKAGTNVDTGHLPFQVMETYDDVKSLVQGDRPHAL